jgi:hypothetical protein
MRFGWFSRVLPLIGVLFLSCCAESGEVLYQDDCGVVYVDPNVTMRDGIAQREACYVHADGGLDYSPCCPEGYTPVGLTSYGEVVCL